MNKFFVFSMIEVSSAWNSGFNFSVNIGQFAFGRFMGSLLNIERYWGRWDGDFLYLYGLWCWLRRVKERG